MKRKRKREREMTEERFRRTPGARISHPFHPWFQTIGGIFESH
jgi:hypothetical protein